MSRGDQRDDIFFDDADRYDFIKTLAEARRKTDWMVQAFCLMKNYYHEAFRKEQLERMEGGLGRRHAGELRRETAQAKADRLVAEELRRLGWRASTEESAFSAISAFCLVRK